MVCSNILLYCCMQLQASALVLLQLPGTAVCPVCVSCRSLHVSDLAPIHNIGPGPSQLYQQDISLGGFSGPGMNHIYMKTCSNLNQIINIS